MSPGSPRRASNSENGSERPREAPRELSPFSQRRAMTMAMNQRGASSNQFMGNAPPNLRGGGPGRPRSRSRSQDTRTSRTSYRKTEDRPRSRSRDRDRKPRDVRDRSRERKPRDVRELSPERKPRESRDRSRESKVPSIKDAAPGSRHSRAPSGSLEPYRPSRERSRDRQRARSKDRRRDRSRDKRRDRSRSRDRKRDRSGDRHRDRSRDRTRDTSRERRRDRSRDRKRDRSRDKYRDRSKDRRRGRDRSRSASPLPYRSSNKRRTRSPSPPRRHRRSPSPHKRRKRSPSASRSLHARSRAPLPDQEVSFRGLDNSDQPPTKYGGAPTDREKPNFKPTGLLAKEANKVEGTKISLKYHEPPEARKPPPSFPWRLWIFKGEDTIGTTELHTQSCWLMGRAREVADILLEHPSCSTQHAAIQFRYIQKTVEDEYGVKSHRGKVKPYIIDLESSNGTELNGEEIEAGRYYQLHDKDILRFGASEREYMIMLPPREDV